MLKGTLEEIVYYVNEITPKYEEILAKLERLCIKGRDRSDNPIPLYLTKYRVKKADSVYLKTKRKNIHYREFTDYGGLRLLCLFEQDIIKVFDYFLSVLVDSDYHLRECYAYNWDLKSDSLYVLKKITEKYFSGYTIRPENKTSGYKSIHCLVVTDEGMVVEVQLRTLVQDVWSELEHTLSYKKGSVHPHIKKSFLLLSNDLQNIDDLFSHLRDISDKEKGGELFSNSKVGPKCYFEYEDDLIPVFFIDFNDVRLLYDKYRKIIRNRAISDIDLLWISEVRSVYEEIKNKCYNQSKSDTILKYWLDMENAFLLFCERRYDEAIESYDKVKNDGNEKYCVYYRLGELYFIKECSEVALNYFDQSEDLLEKCDGNSKYNRFLIKSRLALTYWSLGDEYIDIAIKEATCASEIYEKYKSDNVFSELDGLVIQNSLCWYYLERFIIASNKKNEKKIDTYFTDLQLHFENFEKKINNYDDISVNALDTAMWYYYYKYKRTKNEKDLRKAYDYAMEMKGKPTKNLSFRFANMHINHIQEVMQYSYNIFSGLVGSVK